MGLKYRFLLLLFVEIISAGPLEYSPTTTSQVSSDGQLNFFERLCSGDDAKKKCLLGKIEMCQKYIDGRPQTEQKEEQKIWLAKYKQCQQQHGHTHTHPDELSPSERLNVRSCTFEKMGFATKGKLNREAIKKKIEMHISDAPEAVRKSVLTAVDSCPSPLRATEIKISSYDVCLLQACLSTL